MEEQVELADMIQQIIVDQELVDIQPLELAVEVLADGGGDHACPAGGYTSGNGENSVQAGNNGMGSVGGYGSIGSSGGYYSKGSARSNGLVAYFNQGGMRLLTISLKRKKSLIQFVVILMVFMLLKVLSLRSYLK